MAEHINILPLGSVIGLAHVYSCELFVSKGFCFKMRWHCSWVEEKTWTDLLELWMMWSLHILLVSKQFLLQHHRWIPESLIAFWCCVLLCVRWYWEKKKKQFMETWVMSSSSFTEALKRGSIFLCDPHPTDYMVWMFFRIRVVCVFEVFKEKVNISSKTPFPQ